MTYGRPVARPTHPRDAPVGKYDISDPGAEAQVCALHLDGLRAFVRLAGRSDQSGGQCVISQNFRVSEAIDRVVIDHAGCLHVGINHRGTNKRKSPPLEILAERV